VIPHIFVLGEQQRRQRHRVERDDSEKAAGAFGLLL
jgi:hypothetical protein